MCNVLVYSFVCVLFTCCRISVNAHPIHNGGDKMKEGDSNKTNAVVVEKSARYPAEMSMRPVMVPFYPSFVPSASMPSRYPRVLPMVPPAISSYSVRSPPPPFYQAQQVASNSYMGYRPQMFLSPTTSQFNPSMPTSPFAQHYPQQQPVMPASYSYAPYASNSYALYGSRSVADEEEKLTSYEFVEQPPQSTMQHYPAARGYILSPQVEYQTEPPSTVFVKEYSAIPNSEYSSEPREVFSAEPSLNDVSPMSSSETSDQIYYEVMSPYLTKLGQTAVLPEQQPHLHQMNFRVTEPSTHISIAKPYANVENVNWIWPRSDSNVPIFL